MGLPPLQPDTGWVHAPNPVPPSSPPFLSDPVVRQFGMLCKYALLAMVVTRAPRQPFLEEIPFLGVTVQGAAGYILFFGPFVIAVAVWWFFFIFRGSPIDAACWTKWDLRFAAAIFIFPTIASAFLSFQFFILLAPPGECNTFDRTRYLIDPSLGGFQPDYCMGITKAAADAMPHLFYPLIAQAWFQVLLPLAVAYCSWRLWRRWRGNARKAAFSDASPLPPPGATA